MINYYKSLASIGPQILFDNIETLIMILLKNWNSWLMEEHLDFRSIKWSTINNIVQEYWLRWCRELSFTSTQINK